MVSNYDRIYREIQTEARRVSEDLDVDPEVLQRLTLEIVDLEDRHRISHIHAIDKRVREMIQSTAMTSTREVSRRD